jgi:hypothetical protein
VGNKVSEKHAALIFRVDPGDGGRIKLASTHEIPHVTTQEIII